VLARKKVRVEREGIDRYHLLERLGAALELIEPSAAERSRQLTEWNERLDAQDSAIERQLEDQYSKLPSDGSFVVQSRLPGAR
jgi:hypothetical protein